MNDAQHDPEFARAMTFEAETGRRFETKDSGERRVFSSGMQRDTEGNKPRFDLTYKGPMLERWAWLLHRGALKYDANNWMKAEGEEELERFLSSAARHFAQWMQGDRSEDHAAAVFFNINGAEYVSERMVRENRQRHLESQVDTSEWTINPKAMVMCELGAIEHDADDPDDIEGVPA